MNENEDVGFRPDEFHHSLDAELAVLAAPPLGDLVGLAAQRGRRQRRRRVVGAVGGSVAAVAVVAGLLAGVLGNSPGHRGEIGAAASVPPPTATGSSPTPPSPAEHLVPATAASVLEAVVESLPGGTTSDTYRIDPGNPQLGVAPSAFLYVHPIGGGTGRIAVSVYKPSADDQLTCRPDPVTRLPVGCHTDAEGNVIQLQDNPRNCIQSTTILMQRRDGVQLAIDLSSCLNWDDSTGNAPATGQLTEDQAVTLLKSPLLDYRMPAPFVQAADTRYANLPGPQ